MKLHFASIIPMATAAVAVGIGISLLAATGFSPDGVVDNTWMTLNTSKVGQNAIQISQASNPSGGGGGGGNNGDPTGLTGILTGLLDGLVGGITGAINGGLQDLQGDLVRNLTRAVGLRDVYLFYVSQACEGDYVNASAPGSAIKVTSCYSYKDESQGLRRISARIPTSFTILTTNITVPLVGVLTNTLSSLVDLATLGSALMQATLVIGVVSTGLVMVGSTIFVVIAALQRPPLAVAHLCLAVLGSVAFGIAAVATTAFAYGGAGLIGGGGGDALGVRAHAGSRLVAMAWAAAVVSALAALHWWVVWFVEFRRHAYSKRVRTPQQVGNYRGILREVRADRTLPRDPEPVSKEEAGGAGAGAAVSPPSSSRRRVGII